MPLRIKAQTWLLGQLPENCQPFSKLIKAERTGDWELNLSIWSSLDHTSLLWTGLTIPDGYPSHGSFQHFTNFLKHNNNNNKHRPVKWSFLNFNLMVKSLQNIKIKILCKLPAVCSIYIEFCSSQANILMI